MFRGKQFKSKQFTGKNFFRKLLDTIYDFSTFYFLVAINSSKNTVIINNFRENVILSLAKISNIVKQTKNSFVLLIKDTWILK
jgi:hypothetical protein